MRKAIYVIFIICLHISSGIESICKNNICYGTLNQINSVRGKAKTYFLKPDSFFLDHKTALEKLKIGKKLYCNDTTTSTLTGIYPWRIDRGISLLPSCIEKQIIKRVSQPSESSHLSLLVYAKIIEEEHFAPCSILKLNCDDKSVLSEFHFDNEECLSYLGEEKLASFVSTAVNMNIRKGCNYSSVSNLSGEGPFVLHVRSEIAINQIGKHLSFTNIDGHILLDGIEAMVEIVNVTTVSYNSVMNVTNWTCQSMINVMEHFGLQNVGFVGNGQKDNSCKFHVFVHLFLHVTLGFLSLILLLCCCWQNLEKEKNILLKNKKD